MRRVAIKSNLFASFFLLVIILGIYCTSKKEQTVMLIFGIISTIFCVALFADYLSFPRVMISVNENDQIIIHRKNVILNLEDIIDVSYQRYYSRGIRYKFGSLILKTTKGNYKLRYVSECEEVSKYILNMIYHKD